MTAPRETARFPRKAPRDAVDAFVAGAAPKSTSRGAIDASLPRAAETPHDGHRPSIRPHEGVLPLGRREGGREEEVESLLSIGADVNWRNGDEGETPLIAACRSGHRGVAALLLAHGGDAMGTSRNGESALHAACRRGDEELCALLVDAGAHDEGAFEAGISAGHGQMVQRLRGQGGATRRQPRRHPPAGRRRPSVVRRYQQWRCLDGHPEG